VPLFSLTNTTLVKVGLNILHPRAAITQSDVSGAEFASLISEIQTVNENSVQTSTRRFFVIFLPNYDSAAAMRQFVLTKQTVEDDRNQNSNA
jgi:hypothetical protein